MSDSRRSRKFKPVEFRTQLDKIRFESKCRGNPVFVAECLERYQRYRKGIDEYSFHEDPSKNLPMPYCPSALTIIEDEAIRVLRIFASNMK